MSRSQVVSFKNRWELTQDVLRVAFETPFRFSFQGHLQPHSFSSVNMQCIIGRFVTEVNLQMALRLTSFGHVGN